MAMAISLEEIKRWTPVIIVGAGVGWILLDILRKKQAREVISKQVGVCEMSDAEFNSRLKIIPIYPKPETKIPGIFRKGYAEFEIESTIEGYFPIVARLRIVDKNNPSKVYVDKSVPTYIYLGRNMIRFGNIDYPAGKTIIVHFWIEACEGRKKKEYIPYTVYVGWL